MLIYIIFIFFLGGQVVDLLRAKPLTCDQVLQVFYQTCKAVQHMHKQKPAIVHRDLKVTARHISVELQLHVAHTAG
jgi:serine/threonine protein kinase